MKDEALRNLYLRIKDMEEMVSMYQAAMVDIYQNCDLQSIKNIVLLVRSIDDSFDWQLESDIEHRLLIEQAIEDRDSISTDSRPSIAC